MELSIRNAQWAFIEIDKWRIVAFRRYDRMDTGGAKNNQPLWNICSSQTPNFPNFQICWYAFN